MGTLRWIINIVLILCSASLVVLVLMQQKSSGGLGSAFGGGTENFYRKNKSKSKEARLGLLTKINAGVIAVLSVALVLVLR